MCVATKIWKKIVVGAVWIDALQKGIEAAVVLRLEGVWRIRESILGGHGSVGSSHRNDVGICVAGDVCADVRAKSDSPSHIGSRASDERRIKAFSSIPIDLRDKCVSAIPGTARIVLS